MKRAIFIGIAILVATVVTWVIVRESGASTTAYRFVTVDQGTVTETVASTGTLDAITTVEVGTEVSGSIDQLYADFNDEVVEGQLIAVLDTTLLEIAVRETQANLDRSLAQLKYTQREYERKDKLFEQGLVAETEHYKAAYELETARADVGAVEARLQEAQEKLADARIYAPVSGIVIERDVDVGQTVAASLSSPRLFLIAEDLASMRIFVAVDESDIGKIHAGQPVEFQVQAYPDELFEGTVSQVRLQSEVDQNVVTYTVVIDVGNGDRRLLPGITDGQYTEVRGPDLANGRRVIVGTTTQSSQAASSSPFQSEQRNTRRGPPGPGF